MDFSELLAKEIAKKKQKAAGLKKKSSKYEDAPDLHKEHPRDVERVESKRQRELENQDNQQNQHKEQSDEGNEQDANGDDTDRQSEKRRKLVERLKAVDARRKGTLVDASATKVDTRTPEQTKARLLELGQEESLPNESDAERLKRLQHIEKEITKVEQMKKELKEEEETEFGIKPEDIRAHPDKVYIQIRAYLKYLLVAWEDVLEKRDPDQEDQDELLTKTSKEILDEVKLNLQPLFVLLRQKSLPEEIFPTLSTLLIYLQHKKFTEAETAYISLSIGHSAWPIGIVAVGIHERSALSKTAGINAGAKDVANVVKDGNSRRWITSIKRLINFAQGYLA